MREAHADPHLSRDRAVREGPGQPDGRHPPGERRVACSRSRSRQFPAPGRILANNYFPPPLERFAEDLGVRGGVWRENRQSDL